MQQVSFFSLLLWFVLIAGGFGGLLYGLLGLWNWIRRWVR